MKHWWMARIGKFLLMAALGIAVVAYLMMLLWNALIPELFKGPVISYWQSMGLLALSHMLFRGLGRWHHGHGWHRDRWKHRFEQKLEAMTPEEREKFKEEWRRRCNWEPRNSSQQADTSKA